MCGNDRFSTATLNEKKKIVKNEPIPNSKKRESVGNNVSVVGILYTRQKWVGCTADWHQRALHVAKSSIQMLVAALNRCCNQRASCSPIKSALPMPSTSRPLSIASWRGSIATRDPAPPLMPLSCRPKGRERSSEMSRMSRNHN